MSGFFYVLVKGSRRRATTPFKTICYPLKKADKKECPVCGGSGQISFFQGESRFLLTMEECLECNGTGSLEKEEKKSGKAKGRLKKQKSKKENKSEIQKEMKIENDPWEAIGTLEEDEAIHVLTRLYTRYEHDLNTGKDDASARLFFRRLGQTIEQCKDCNLNRR